MSYCVITEPSSPFFASRQTGTYSSSGPGAMTTPAACTELCRFNPSIRMTSSSRPRIRASERYRSAISFTFSIASAAVIENPGSEGISFAIRSVSCGVNPCTRPTSRTAARASMVPKVMIWPTDSAPYLSRT